VLECFAEIRGTPVGPVERTPGDDRTIESPSVFGRTYHDAPPHFAPSSLYHVRRRHDDNPLEIGGGSIVVHK
jgi:hypothetical protein